MELQEIVSCRIRIKAPSSETGRTTLASVHDHPEVNSDIRKQWVKAISKAVESDMSYQKIRPLEFVLGVDGTVEPINSVLSEKSVLPSQRSYGTVYASRYRIPSRTMNDLDDKEKVRRAVFFALGSLIYEIHAGKEPFWGLDDDEIQRRYSNAQFPDVTTLEQWPLILSCWSNEFALELRKFLAKRASQNKFQKFTHATGNYLKAHPYVFGLQVAGAAVGVTALATPLVLGAIGFGALGPIAGSSAAAWQASMGLVEAGSLFAWCQGAAMGGAAAGGIIAAGATGAGIAASATAAGVLTGMSVTEKEELMKLFQKVCRRPTTPKISGPIL